MAAKHPEKIVKVAIDPVSGFMPFHGRELAFGLGLKGKEVGKAVAFMKASTSVSSSATRHWSRSIRWW